MMLVHGPQVMQAVTLILDGGHSADVKEQVNIIATIHMYRKRGGENGGNKIYREKQGIRNISQADAKINSLILPVLKKS